MEEQLKKLLITAKEKIEACESSEALLKLQVEFLGKKGSLTTILRQMGKLSPQERPKIGRLANEVKTELAQAFTKQEEILKAVEQQKQWQQESLDITLPGIKPRIGHQHPLKIMEAELREIFISMGFQVATGPEVETDYYNFEALNIPLNHPSRDMQDTFYLEHNLLLRTHTSNVQIRTMESQAPPIKIIAPGRCYRVDELDANHSPVFHQIEGLVIDTDISFSHLKGILVLAARQIFGQNRQVRFRPSFFPFTEPSAEVDVSCFKCNGAGCRFCSQSGWLEILGAGMVDPRVLEMSGIDPEKYTGFAFGMGIDRMAMYKFEIDDIRHFWDNDVRFLHQF